ncbi:MAG: glycoside hydrolase family 9 protein [Planctomycetota bacterium]
MNGSEFTRHALMAEVYEDSYRHRCLSKTVHESKIVDDMESDGGWGMDGIGEVGYTAERAMTGRRSLRFRTAMRDEEHLREERMNESFGGGQGGYATATLEFDEPRDWSRFNRLSLWVYVHPTAMHAWCFHLSFRCRGFEPGPVSVPPVHFVHDLAPGRWNHVVWEIPNFRRDAVTQLSISQTLRGHGPEEDGQVVYDFDRIEVQRVDAEKYEGWEVAPGKIAFNHVGYRPGGRKVALACGTGAEQFEVLEETHQRTVATFPVETVENERGRFEVLDFSDLAEPGRYRLRCGEALSRPFAVDEHAWFGTIEKALNFYYGERCGWAVPGVHGVCHADLQGTHEGETRLINGGWHDAGDLSQGSHRTGASVYAMLRVREALRRRDLEPGLRARLLEEACWGLDWLLKTRFGNGYRITWALGRIYTDNEVGTVDDTVVPARHTAHENFLFAAVGAYAHETLAEVRPDRARRALEAAETDYAATMERRSDWSEVTRTEAALGALAAAHLFRATGGGGYAEDAAAFGRRLTACQEQRFVDGIPITGYFYTDTSRERVVHDHHMSFEESPLVALQALCETFPEHEDWMEWYGAVLLHSEYFCRRGAEASAPYRLLPNSVWSRAELERVRAEWQERGRDPDALAAQFEEGTPLGEDHRLRVFPIWRDHLFHGATGVRLSATVALAAAARLRNRRPLQELVDAQFRWIFGGNPFSQCLMYGEGYDYQPLFAYCLRNLVGALPVGVDSLHDDAPCWPAFNDATYKEMWVVPVSRFLWTAAYAAVPARVEGTAPERATFTEAGTGRRTAVSGAFALNLSPGTYRVECGGAERSIELLPGTCRELSLDPDNMLDVDLRVLEQDRSAGRVRIGAVAHGSGRHGLRARAFNAAVEAPGRRVDLSAGEETTVIWDLTVKCAEKPWAMVVVPDANLDAKREVFGTLRDLPEIA